MKRLLSIGVAIAVILGSNTANAQVTATSSTNVRIVLSDFITAAAGNQTEVGATPATAAVTFNYPTAASYTAIQELELADHLKVTASKVFKVMVKAAAANFVKGTDNIPVGVVDIKVTKVTAVVGATTTPSTPTTPVITLTAGDQDLITNVASGIKTFDVKYSIPADRAQANILGKPSGTYSQVVVYTFSQP